MLLLRTGFWSDVLQLRVTVAHGVNVSLASVGSLRAAFFLSLISPQTEVYAWGKPDFAVPFPVGPEQNETVIVR